jgi:hypothetical protein
LEVDDLPEAFFAALVEFLPEDFVKLFFVEVLDELALSLFTEVLAAAFLLGAALLFCEPWVEVGFLLDVALLPEPAVVCAKLAGTPSPANKDVSRTRSAAGTSLISRFVTFIVCVRNSY